MLKAPDGQQIIHTAQEGELVADLMIRHDSLFYRVGEEDPVAWNTPLAALADASEERPSAGEPDDANQPGAQGGFKRNRAAASLSSVGARHHPNHSKMPTQHARAHQGPHSRMPQICPPHFIARGEAR